MTEGLIQGEWFWVRNNGDFEITEFGLAGYNCIRGSTLLPSTHGLRLQSGYLPASPLTFPYSYWLQWKTAQSSKWNTLTEAVLSFYADSDQVTKQKRISKVRFLVYTCRHTKQIWTTLQTGWELDSVTLCWYDFKIMLYFIHGSY